MKILHILLGKPRPDTADGVSKSVYFLAKYQYQEGADVCILSLTRKCKFNGEIMLEKPRTVLFRQPRARFLLGSAFYDRIREIHPEIVHFHSAFVPEFQHIGSRLSRMGIPYAISPHGAFRAFGLKRSFKKKIWLRLLESTLLKKAKIIHFLTSLELKDFDLLHINTNARKIIVPNGIENQLHRDPIKEKRYLIERFGLPCNSSIILSLGRLTIGCKGLDLLIQGFSQLPRDYLKKCYLFLVGPDVNGSVRKLKRIADDFNIADRVHLIGPVYGDDKFRLMAGADLFVIPSRSEGFPIALLEALSAGARCVVSTETGIGEEIIEHQAGWLCNPTCGEIATSLQKALREIKSSRKINEISRNAVNLTKQKYTWQSVAEKILESYHEG